MNNTTLQKATDINKLNKQILTDFMSQNGIDRIILNFDGSGDSGQIDECRCYPELKDKFLLHEIEITRCHHRFSEGEWSLVQNQVKVPISEAAEDIAYTVLENKHGGWEINDGSYGTIVINADGSGSIEYNERVMTTEYSESEF